MEGETGEGCSASRVGIIGAGRLGLCAALVLERKGFHAVAVDLISSYVDQINARTLVSPEPLVSEYLRESKHLRATTDIDEAIAFADLLMIYTDTPSGPEEKVYDHKNLSNVLDKLNDRRVRNKNIVICCTVLPGYIANTARCLIQDTIDSTISYNPAFIAQGDIIRGFQKPDLVLIGEGSTKSGDVLEALYRRVCENQPPVRRMSCESAEITKLALNCFITMKISFSNMIGDMADETPNADKSAILSTIGLDSRVGPKCMNWGYGFGGPCFPRDNRALAVHSRRVGIEPIIPKCIDESNRVHALKMAAELIKERRETYVFEEVTYKDRCSVPIIECSQKLEVARLVREDGHRVVIRDRAAVLREVRKEFGSIFEYESTDEARE